MRKLIRIVPIVAMACILNSVAIAHEHATGIVKERMDVMEEIGRRMKSINTRMKMKRDVGAINEDAKAIAERAAHIVHLFPPGSMQPPTDARSSIWKNWSDFERLAKALETESAKLAETSSGDIPALTTQVRAVSRVCNDCHEPYRLKR